MIDWRSHIDGEPGTALQARIKGAGIEVEAVLALLRDGWTLERVIEHFPMLSSEDVRACLDYALELLKRAQFHAEIRRRISQDDAHPDEAISLEDFRREILPGARDSEDE